MLSMSEAQARVTLKRLPRPLGDIGRTYKVFIDDQVVLSDNKRLAAEYKSLKAKRPDWAHSE
jgi:hypothetical protein